MNLESISSKEDIDEFSLKDILMKITKVINLIFDNIRLIIFTSLIFAVFGFTYAKYQKRQYKAILTFALEEDKGGGSMGGFGGLASQFGIDLGSSGGGAFSGANLIELMKSRLLVEKALLRPIRIEGKNISLAEYYLKINNIRDRLNQDPNFNKILFTPNENRLNYSLQKDSILFSIFKNLTDPNFFNITQKDKKVSITTLEINNEDELFAKYFCETLAKETSDYYIEIKSKKAKKNAEILQYQVDSIRNELDNTISGFALSNDNVYNLNPAMMINRAPSSKKQINIQFNTAILSQLLGNLELAKVTLRKETPLIQIIDTPILPLEKIQLSKSKSALIGLFLGIIFSITGLLIRNWVLKQLN